ncbi:transposase [Gluconobacter thailandicus NBRC 3255]|nr:transposase [Gluconobacter thailandicus NBRC 3255]
MVRLSTNASGQRYPRSLTTQNATVVLEKSCISSLCPGISRSPTQGKYVIRSRVEHVFADQKLRTELFIRTVDIIRAVMTIGLANIIYNMRRCLFCKSLTPQA